jgi:hypothetical protein
VLFVGYTVAWEGLAIDRMYFVCFVVLGDFVDNMMFRKESVDLSGQFI